MDEQNRDMLPGEEYIPRPRWQVWGARAGLVFMALAIAAWLYNIAFPL